MTEQERQAVATRASAILVESGAYFPSLHADAIPLVDALIPRSTTLIKPCTL